MAVAIEFRFLSGRFHATPWDRHPNEGVPEWPPAPWRILRALVASAYRADGDPAEADLHTMITALSAPPKYFLPRATAAHVRSYQPLFKAGASTLVLDAFVVPGAGAGGNAAPITVVWDQAHLDDHLLATLDRWLSNLGYLGRAESWVEAARTAAPLRDADAEPIRNEATGRDIVRLLAADSSDGPAVLQSITTDTETLFKNRMAEPAATTFVDYAFRDAAFAVPAKRARGAAVDTLPTLIRLALGTRVLPRLTVAVRFGDRVRAALMSRSRDADGLPHQLFAGKSRDGTPLATNDHVHVLPVDEDRDGAIDHIVLWAPAGFDQRAFDAATGLSWLWGDEGFDLRVAFVGSATSGGDLDALGVTRAGRGYSVCARSAVWRSRTPFVLTRHPKVRQGRVVDGPEDQLRRELVRLGFPSPIRVTPIAGTDAPSFVAWHRFRLQRTTGGGSRASDRGLGFEVEFPTSVVGPIAVGYGARQGLGQFEPAG